MNKPIYIFPTFVYIYIYLRTPGTLSGEILLFPSSSIGISIPGYTICEVEYSFVLSNTACRCISSKSLALQYSTFGTIVHCIMVPPS